VIRSAKEKNSVESTVALGTVSSAVDSRSAIGMTLGAVGAVGRDVGGDGCG